MSKLNVVMIIPTGLGCALGGDAAYNSGVKLIASTVNNLIINPNAVNASDINELPDNALYTEGSTIDRFLQGKLNLQKIKTFNKVLMVVNKVSPASLNSANAGIWGLGADVSVLLLSTPLLMKATMLADGTAGGKYSGIDELVRQVSDIEFDALAVQTPIDCDDDIAENYWQNGGVNPWGGVEALISKAIAERINKPVAHAPSESIDDDKTYTKIVVARAMAPEVISNTYTFCILKGLHRAPRLILDVNKQYNDLLKVDDIDFLLTPHGCWGTPHIVAQQKNIPIIVVKENTTCFSKNFTYPYYKNLITVNNYLEAAGLLQAMSCGVDYRTVLL